MVFNNYKSLHISVVLFQIVYGISHPKYREALAKKYPRLCNVNNKKEGSEAGSIATTTEGAMVETDEQM